MFTRPMFKIAKAYVVEAVASTTAGTPSALTSTAYGENFSVTVQCTTGNLWVNSLVAATTANGFKMEEAQTLDLKVLSSLSIVSDSTTAKYQAIVWGD